MVGFTCLAKAGSESGCHFLVLTFFFFFLGLSCLCKTGAQSIMSTRVKK
jgi:hypothetical protein